MTSNSDWMANEIKQLGATAPGGMNSVEQQMYGDLASSAMARRDAGMGDPYSGGGYLSGLSGFKFPPWLSPDDLTRALNQAESFAAQTGWAYFPDPSAILWLARNGSNYTQQMASSAFWQKLPNSAQGKFPWAQFGLDSQSYTDKQRQYQETYYQLTGKEVGNDKLGKSFVWQAMTNNWSAQRFQEAMQNDPTAQSQFGWLKYGMNYQDMRHYVTQNQAALQSRFGQKGATVENALKDLGNPLQQFSAYAPPVQQVAQTPQSENAQTSVRTTGQLWS